LKGRTHPWIARADELSDGPKSGDTALELALGGLPRRRCSSSPAITAPFAGTVSTRAIERGELVGSGGAPMFTRC